MNTTIEPYKHRDLVPAISVLRTLAKWLEQLVLHTSIPAAEAEAEANRAALHEAQEQDRNSYGSAVKLAIANYREQNSVLDRFVYFMKRGFRFYRPDIASVAASPETQLLEQVVALQEAVVKGYGLFKALPDVVQKMKHDYENLFSRKQALEARLAEVEDDFRTLPERQREYTAMLQRMEEYNALSEQDKKTLWSDLRAKTGVDVLPPLDNAAVRSKLQQGLAVEKQRLNGDNLSLLLEVLNIEYDSVQRQLKIIGSQEHQLGQECKPALLQLSRLNEQYVMLSRYTSGARLLIGMNQLRAETSTLIAESEEAMRMASEHIRDTTITAEAYEEAFTAPKNVRILTGADADEAVEADGGYVNKFLSR